jgi:hypothetical protein
MPGDRSPSQGPRSKLAIVGAAWILSATACLGVVPPPVEDPAAFNDSYAQATSKPPACQPMVELLRSEGEARRPYREVANLSANCYPGTPQVCERRLLDRACELKADAVILKPAEPGGSPPGGSSQSRTSLGARAVRWTE